MRIIRIRDLEKQRKYARDWAAKNRHVTNFHRSKSRRVITERLKDLKEASPCIDCGGYFPACAMHYDHLDPTTKIKAVSRIRQYKWVTIVAEIEKCELVCANCHAIRGAVRDGSLIIAPDGLGPVSPKDG